MKRRLAALVVCASLAACAGLEPAGRNASRAPQAAPTRVASAPAPVAAPTPAPAPSAAPVPAPPPISASPAPAPVAAPSTPPPLARTPPSAPPSTPPAREPVVTAPTPASPPVAPAPVIATSRSGDDVVVQGQRERQVAPPEGDPRSTAERMEDIRAWDRCVTTVQAAYERDPLRVQADSPEEYCARSLGMAERTAVPLSRLERRR